MTWTAIVPLKLGAERKSRLARRLMPEERVRLSDEMAAHVLDCLARTPEVSRVVVLAPVRPADPACAWIADLGRGLNAELEAARTDFAPASVLVVFGDLPLLRADDVSALLAEAERAGVALAPDRDRLGTNALALAQGRAFRFAFGEGSFARHCAQAPDAAIVERQGLAHDVDTEEDLAAARAAGFRSAKK